MFDENKKERINSIFPVNQLESADRVDEIPGSSQGSGEIISKAVPYLMTFEVDEIRKLTAENPTMMSAMYQSLRKIAIKKLPQRKFRIATRSTNQKYLVFVKRLE